MVFENLSEREKLVLTNLINHYITTAEPVGSRVIANKFGMGVSAATIRNTLQDLEDKGLITQPHTSAGRIPTDLGYRFYVDCLIKPAMLSQEEKQYIKGEIVREGRGIREILGQTCQVLSSISNQLGVTVAPAFERGILRSISLIPITVERLMVVAVLESGLARNVVLEVESTIAEKALREVESMLNQRLSGLTLREIKDTISDRLSDVSGHGKLLNLLVDSRDRIWSDLDPQSLRLSGATNLVGQPEFSSRDKLSSLLRLIENDQILTDFLKNATDEELIITIGTENRLKEIADYSLVTSRYKVGKLTGVIGIIGPTRMAYSKLVSVVQYTARAMSDVLSGLEQSEQAQS